MRPSLTVDNPLSPGTPASAVVPVRVIGSDAALTTHRNAKWRIDLLDNNDAPLGTMDGVLGGGLKWTANAQIKGRGSLELKDTGSDIDWLNVRIRPVYVLNDTIEWRRSIFIPALPREDWTATGRAWSASLLDKSAVLDRDRFDYAYALDAGTNVIDAVRDLITGAGEDAGAVTDSVETLTTARVWPTGTSRLTIANDLLDSINYFALYVGMDGAFRAEPYTSPANRASSYDLIDSDEGIYLPDLSRTQDVFSIPNKIIRVTQGTLDTAGLIGVATNTDPTSPYSYASRGNRWITNEDAAQPIEATSQAVIDAIALRDLVNATSATATIELEHAPLDTVVANAALRFRHTPGGIDARHVVTDTELTIEAAGALALAKTTLREVANL